MNVKSENIAVLLIRHRIYVILVFLFITILSTTQLKKLRVYNELDIWIDRSGSEYSNYLQFRQKFGEDESIQILLHTDSLFSNTWLRLNYQLTDSLKAIPGVRNVLSLSSVKIPSPLLAGPSRIPLIPMSSTQPEKLKNRVLQFNVFRNLLISEDGKTSSFTILIDTTASKNEVFRKVKTTADKIINGHAEAVLFGVVPLKAEVNRLSGSESKAFLSISIIMMIILNYLFFRRLRESVIPILIALITICWTLGLLAAAGLNLNVVLSILPIILLMVSIAFSIHFISGIIRCVNDNMDLIESIPAAFRKVFKNCFYSALTTSFALIVFSTSGIFPLVIFGIFAAVGVLIAFLITFGLLPVIYSYFGSSSKRFVFDHQYYRPFLRLADTVNRYRKTIYAACSVILVLSLAGISRLEISTDQVNYLKKSNPIRIATEKAGEWFTGIVPIEIIFTFEPGIYSDPGVLLQKFSEADQRLEDIPEIISLQSPAMILDDIKRTSRGSFRINALNARMVESNEFLSHYVSSDGKSLRVTVKTTWMNDRQLMALLGKIGAGLDEVFQDTGIDFHFTGSASVFARLSQRLVKSQVRSVLLSFLLIMGAFLLLYKSIKWTFLCLIPNILPVACTLGIMGFLAIPIDVATVLIASVSLGIAIDDTIHFVSTFREALPGTSKYHAVLKAYLDVGKPLIATSLLLIFGFLVMAFSSYRPIVFLGTFMSINLFLALLYDLILLPAILLYKDTKIYL